MSMLLKPSIKLKWFIVFALTILCLVVPEQGIYTFQVKMFLSITVFGLSLAAFELVDMLVISFIMPSLWVLFGVASADVVMSPWLGTTFLLIPGSLFLAATLEDCGLLKRLALHLMGLVKGSYFGLLLSVMIAGIILNVLTVGYAYLIMPALAAGLCMALKGMNKKLGAGLATAVMLGCCTGHTFTYNTGAWAVILPMASDYISAMDITPANLTLHSWPLFIVCLVILFIVSKWYKPEDDLGDTDFLKEELAAMGKNSYREKMNIGMLALLLIYIFTINIHGMDINLGFAIIPWLVYLPFIKAADSQTLKKMNVPIIFFVAACMAIGNVATSLGLGDVIANLCKGFLAESQSVVAITCVIFGIVFLLNFLMTPMAIWALMTGPVCLLVSSMDLPVVPFLYVLCYCAEAIILPYEYVPYLLVFSFGMISMKDFIKVNILRSAIFFIGFLVLLLPYWKLIGLL